MQQLLLLRLVRLLKYIRIKIETLYRGAVIKQCMANIVIYSIWNVTLNYTNAYSLFSSKFCSKVPFYY
jgi:hypothetical protein